MAEASPAFVVETDTETLWTDTIWTFKLRVGEAGPVLLERRYTKPGQPLGRCHMYATSYEAAHESFTNEIAEIFIFMIRGAQQQ